MNSACVYCKGACCKSLTLDLSRFPADAIRWAAFHGELEEDRVRFRCKCQMLKNGLCSIYDNRPTICKDFAVGSRGCIEAIKKHEPHKMKTLLRLMEREGVFGGS